MTSLETARSLAIDPRFGGLRGNSPGNAASPISFLPMVALEGATKDKNSAGENSLHLKANMLPLFSRAIP